VATQLAPSNEKTSENRHSRGGTLEAIHSEAPDLGGASRCFCDDRGRMWRHRRHDHAGNGSTTSDGGSKHNGTAGDRSTRYHGGSGNDETVWR
jgi:hypothetical protein